MKRARVLLADDHKLLLEAFHKLLEPEFDVVGTVLDGRALLDAAARLKPDVIVLDIAMPVLNGMDAARQLRRIAPDARLIFLTVSDDPDLAREALAIGASAFLLKASAASELFHAIRAAMRGEIYLTPLVTRAVGTAPLDTPALRKAAHDLSPRQREVLQLLAEGHSMKDTAKILRITPRTIAFHKYRMIEELGLRNSAELVQYAVKHRIVSP